MLGEPIDEFLNQVAVERQPLTDQEKKEAMVVAKEVWKKSSEKTKGRDSVFLDLYESNCDTVVHISNPRHKDSKYPRALLLDPNADLVIYVLRFARGERGIKQEKYDFSPETVTKLEIHKPQADHISTEDALQEELSIAKYLKREKELTTEERYHPDKHDLKSLLKVVSSAQESHSL